MSTLDFYNPVQFSGKKFSEEIPGKEIAMINGDECLHCNICYEKCHYSAIDNRGLCYCVDEYSCEGCGLCASLCPADVIDMIQRIGAKLEVIQKNNCILIQVSEIFTSFSPDKTVDFILDFITQNFDITSLSLYAFTPPVSDYFPFSDKIQIV